MSSRLRILTVVGARPQFVKAAALSSALRERDWDEYLVHTGQHYDDSMSEVFFSELGIPDPDVNLGIGSGHHGETTGRMMAGIERECLEDRPDLVLVYGDTNSTLAAALVASKLHIPIAHVESGLRSFDRRMPEEVNRILADHVSSLLFCPSQSAVTNLKKEGVTEGVFEVGDIMRDALCMFLQRAKERSNAIERFGLNPGEYALLTIHRPSNTDDVETLEELLEAAGEMGPVLFPAHPRCSESVRELISRNILKDNIQVVEPLGYLDFLAAASQARFIATDSGGLQKEAYWLKVPCITLREQTEWIETVETGWNRLVGNSAEAFRDAVCSLALPKSHHELYGDGKTAIRICDIISDWSG